VLRAVDAYSGDDGVYRVCVGRLDVEGETREAEDDESVGESVV